MTLTRPGEGRVEGERLCSLILVGGEGTRLRPLTSTVPSRWCARRQAIYLLHVGVAAHTGIDDVIMSCGFLATSVRNVLGDGSAYGSGCASWRGPPRGTAGALSSPSPCSMSVS